VNKSATDKMLLIYCVYYNKQLNRFLLKAIFSQLIQMEVVFKLVDNSSFIYS